MESPASRFLNLSAMIFPVLLLFLRASVAGIASDTLNNGGNITDGETLVSSGSSFTLGFFSPAGVPAKRYLGIWFTASPDAVCWVANRDTPISNTSGVGVLVVGSTGSLRLLDGSGQTAWSSNTTSSAPAVAQLLESGNLVVREQSSEKMLWQSFDHPSNTLLAGMRLGKDPQTGAEWFLTSWRAPNDPTTGDCRRVMDTRGLPDCVSWQGNTKQYRTGPWNGLWFSGVPEMASYSELFSNQVVVRPDEIAYIFNTTADAPFSRLVLERGRRDAPAGMGPRQPGVEHLRSGAEGRLRRLRHVRCVVGFSPVNPSQWSMRESGGGCRRNVPLECGNGTTTDGFRVVRGVKLPDTDNTTVDMGATLEQCRARCLANCSCVAYAAADIRGGGDGTGCVMWKDNIVDVRYVDKGQDLYLRLAKSELANRKRTDVVKIVLPVTASLLALVAVALYLVWICKLRGRRRNKDVQKKAMVGYLTTSHELGDENLELPFVSFEDIVTATDNFSEDNMLGQGGFGKVYKGMLGEKKEVAIKRLGQGSGQGADEFRNEVVLIAKLQHRNLVRLLGWCIWGDEKLLAWSLWNEGKAMDLVDSSLVKSCLPNEAFRCIQIGLLCVQDNPNSRPLMSSVVFMLENETTALSVPKQPVFFSQRYSEAQETGENTSSSTNNMSMTVLLEGR
ncbi:unnamed protein product [Miscanthus lutarioriparius]|uniref:non-specific serine/threonine protein kinase n=1 Tax=Miscanthus lutarioriparius TaxID=422564 RepID=A0A811QZX6_9POAL|nr:unnamed protein product [Miscanthus lutarioriparius]